MVERSVHIGKVVGPIPTGCTHMTYDIYFHDDYDGRASAAVMLAFFKSRGDKVKKFVPVDYSIERKWPTMRFERPAVIVDFLYHPKATFWFDHHTTTFLKSEWEKKFKQTKYHSWKPEYLSCCHQVLDVLKKDFHFKPPKHLEELVKWLDIVDGARYRSAKQAIEKREPALLIEEFVDRNRKGETLEWLVKLLAEKPLRSVVKHPEFIRLRIQIAVQNKKMLAWYRAHVELHGRVGFTDLTGKGIIESRFAPYYVHPKLLYSVRLKYNMDRSYHLSVGANPWRRGENKVHIGKFLREKYGGGGHHDVGGAETRSRVRAFQMAKESIEKFQ